LFSTHILSEAEQVCDRVLIMDKGKIVAQGKPAELRKKLQPGATLYVEIQTSAAKARDLLKAIPGVESVEAEGNGFVVRASKETDIRSEVSSRILKAGYTLLEMRAMTSSLEAIFLDIISKEN
jgi:ABC-2 type transport system ATP-binding protein